MEFRQDHLVNMFSILEFTWQLGLMTVFPPAHARWEDGEKDTKTRQGVTKVREKGLIVGVITAKHLQSVIFVHVWFLKKSCLFLLI